MGADTTGEDQSLTRKYESATRKEYTREYKRDTVKLVAEQGNQKTEAVRNLDWVKEFPNGRVAR